MNLIFRNLLLFIPVFFCFSCTSYQKKTEGQKAIEAFYQAYFKTLHEPQSVKPQLRLSSSFSELIVKNRSICKAKAGSDVCGWDSRHGDDYLNAQEIDADLTFENSEFKSSEPKPHWIRIEFNVFPSAKTNKSNYKRVIEYMMIREEMNLVVDDIIIDGQSFRKIFSDEIEHYNK